MLQHKRLLITMTYRERVIRTVCFEPVDELPFDLAFGLMPEVLDDWRAEGLPSHIKTESDLRRHYGFPVGRKGLPIRTYFHPLFEEEVLEDNEDYRIARDSLGRTTKVYKKYFSIPQPLDYPVKDMATWRNFKRRLQFSPERIGANLEEVAAWNVANGHLNFVGLGGFYWFPRDLMGDEALCVAYYEQPELIHDINDTWCRMIEAVLGRALQRVCVDVVHCGEDMAYRGGSLVSRRIFDEFIGLYYRRVNRLIQKHEVPVFSVDSDGRLDELIEWLSGCGVNLIQPMEVQAGNDLCGYRRRFGRKMAYEDGLDKRELVKGREAIDALLQRTIPFMKESGGGWIIGQDHRVLKGTRLADFEYYVRRVREMAKY
jgi:hypothetical protein